MGMGQVPINRAPVTRITQRVTKRSNARMTTRITIRATKRNAFEYKVELMLLLFSSGNCRTSAGLEWPTRSSVLCSTDWLGENSNGLFGDLRDMLHRVLCSTPCCGTAD